MDKRMKTWAVFAVLMAAGIALSVAAAFLVAGLLIAIREHLEIAVLTGFAGWILWFGWHTKDAFLDETEDEEVWEPGEVIIYYDAKRKIHNGRLSRTHNKKSAAGRRAYNTKSIGRSRAISRRKRAI